VAARGMGEVVKAVKQAVELPEVTVRPSASTTRWVGSPASTTGAVRSSAMVVRVPALRRVLIGESTGSISDKNS
jgi:hypothetical protein